MNSQHFFILNLVLAGIFLLWFLNSRKDSGIKPTKLKLKKDAGSPPPMKEASETKPVAAPEAKASLPAESPEAPPPRPEKTLNVLFIYNGHDWDAYEVLGLPAGSSLPQVTARYQEMVRSAEAGKLEFLEAAYQAILKKT